MTLIEIMQTPTDDLKKRYRKVRKSINHDDCIEAILIENELALRAPLPAPPHSARVTDDPLTGTAST